MHYEEADDDLFSAFEAEAEEFLQTIGRTQYKNTYRALIGFIFKTNALKTGIFDAVESENPYVLRILFRVLCEHYLKFTYILMRFMDEKTDNAGTDFFLYCGAVEARDYAKSLRLSESLIGNDFAINLERLITANYPRASELSVKKLEAKSAEFRYREILRYLAKHKSSLISSRVPFLASIIPAYAELSSFIHGGPMADEAMTMFGSEEEIMLCEEKASLAFMMAASIYSFTALIVASEFKEFMPLAIKLHSIVKKYSERTENEEEET